MSNSGKIWDTREAYQKQRANTWETPGNRGMRMESTMIQLTL